MPAPQTDLPQPEGGDHALHAGREVFGRYRLEKVAGRGGMGVVWRAFDTRLERVVALKFLPDQFFSDVAARDDLKRETRRSLELTHPHIVRIYDFVEDEFAAAISMEYVDGATLSQRRIEQPERFFECESLHGWVAALCLALDYAHHTACFVHHDLKPGNLMVNGRGVLKVTDFGIAVSMRNTVARVTSIGSTGGTLGYMSPQQLMGELPSPTDDIYSLGATLYELLTGKPPFHGGDLNYQIRELMPESIAERRRKLGVTGHAVDPRWEETILACLAKAPQDRPSDAMDVARRLGLAVSPTADPSVSDCSPTVTPGSPAPVKPGPTLPLTLRAVYDTARPHLIRHRRILAVGGFVLLFLAAWFRPREHEASRAAIPAATAKVEALAPATPFPVQAPPASTPAPEVAPAQAASDREFLASTAPATPITSAKLQITTTPPGISFRVLKGAYESSTPELIAEGTTPALAQNLPPGACRVQLSAPGLGERSFSLRLSSEGVTQFERSFPHGTVKIQSTPAGAEIYCDDQLLGTAPVEAPLLPGEHHFRAEAGDEESQPKTVAVNIGANQSLAFDFHAGTTIPRRAHHRAVKKAEPSTLVKIGKSISNFFTGGNASHR